MSRLLEALKKKYKTPREALQQLGLDAALVNPAVGGGSEEKSMKTKWTPTGLVVLGAMNTYLRPRIAADAQISLPILRAVTGKTFKAQIPQIAADVKAAVKGKLAADADVEDVEEVLQAIGEMDPQMLAASAEEPGGSPPVEGDPKNDAPPMEGDPEDDAPPMKEPEDKGGDSPAVMAKVREWLKDKVPPETMAEFDEMIGEEARGQDEVNTDPPADHDKDPAEDEDPDETSMDNDIPGSPDFKGAPKVGKGAGMDKAAMDAAIDSRVTAAVAAERNNQTAIRTAFTFVRPWVGELAMDASSPHDVYRAALRARGVAVKDLPDAALKPVLEAQPRAGARQQRQIAGDAGGKTPSFTEMFPSATRIGHA